MAWVEGVSVVFHCLFSLLASCVCLFDLVCRLLWNAVVLGRDERHLHDLCGYHPSSHVYEEACIQEIVGLVDVGHRNRFGQRRAESTARDLPNEVRVRIEATFSTPG